jgi:hypothetical protein
VHVLSLGLFGLLVHDHRVVVLVVATLG